MVTAPAPNCTNVFAEDPAWLISAHAHAAVLCTWTAALTSHTLCLPKIHLKITLYVQGNECTERPLGCKKRSSQVITI